MNFLIGVYNILVGIANVTAIGVTAMNLKERSEFRALIESTTTFSNFDEARGYILQEYLKGKQEITFSAEFYADPSSVLKIFEDKRRFPFNNSYKCEVETLDKTRFVKITITHTQGFNLFLAVIKPCYEESLSKDEKMVLEKIHDIHRKIITSSMSKYEKAKKVHDYLISTSSYDYENYKINKIPEESYTPYGLLFKHKAVCQAFAETYMIFMTLCGVECLWVSGRLNASSNISTDNHSWNIIKIDGKYGHVDVTSDNPVPKNYGLPLQKHFFVSDSLMDRTHEWNISYYPLCI